MAVYELHYRRLPARSGRPRHPAATIARAEIDLLLRRRGVRLVLLLALVFALAPTGYVVIRSGILADYLPPGLPLARLAPVDGEFFAGLLRSSGYRLLLVLLALFIGSGRIAEDLRANALTIYLARPITRGDYLLGKVAATAAAVALGALGIPLLTWLTAVLTTPDFLGQHGSLGLRLGLNGLVATAYLTSTVLLCSSLVKSGRVAAMLFAGLYFVSGSFQSMTSLALRGTGADFLGYGRNLDTLALHLLGTPGPRDPPLLPALGAIAAVTALASVIARRRIRAVEVVR